MNESNVASKTAVYTFFLTTIICLFGVFIFQLFQNRSQEVSLEELRSGDLGVKSITYDKLAEDVFTTVELELEDGTISQARVISGTVQGGLLVGQLRLETESGEVIEGTVTEYVPTQMEIEDGSITEEKLTRLFVERIEKLEGDSEEEPEEGESDIPSTGIADGSIVTVKLADGGVTTAKLADGSVTTIKIVDASITSGKIRDAVILTQHLGDSSVTSVKIANGTIVNADISNTASISYSKLNLSGSIQLSDLGQNACTNGQVMKWNNIGVTWACANDTNTQLSEAQVEGYVTNGIINLFAGSTLNSQAIATENWVTGLGFVTAASSTTLTNKTIDGDDNTVQDLTVNSLKSGVLDTDLSSVSASDDTIASAKAIRTALNALYPVGSIYINASVSTNPATLLGFGTWVAFGSGKVMVGLDSGDASFDTLGETGGAKTHTLTTAELPAHTHTNSLTGTTTFASSTHTHAQQSRFSDPAWATSNGFTYGVGVATSADGYTKTGGPSGTASVGLSNASSGSGNAHNNLQPYIVVYMWVRTE